MSHEKQDAVNALVTDAIAQLGTRKDIAPPEMLDALLYVVLGISEYLKIESVVAESSVHTLRIEKNQSPKRLDS